MRQQIFEEALEAAREVLEGELLAPTNPRVVLAEVYAIINRACREPHDDMRSIVRGIINQRE